MKLVGSFFCLQSKESKTSCDSQEREEQYRWEFSTPRGQTLPGWVNIEQDIQL